MQPDQALATPLAELSVQAHGYLEQAIAVNTRQVYRVVALIVQRAAAAGLEERLIAQQTGHKSLTVPRRNLRHGELFRPNAAAAVGL